MQLNISFLRLTSCAIVSLITLSKSTSSQPPSPIALVNNSIDIDTDDGMKKGGGGHGGDGGDGDSGGKGGEGGGLLGDTVGILYPLGLLRAQLGLMIEEFLF